MTISRRDALIASGTTVTGLSLAAFAIAGPAAEPTKVRKERYPVLTPEEMYFEQRRVAQAVDGRRSGGMAGPFIPLTYVPGVLDRQQMLGEQARFHTSVPPKLREWAICIAARNVNSWYVFSAHGPLALRGGAVEDQLRWGSPVAGVAKENVDALAAQRRPPKLEEDEGLVYDFCMEFHTSGAVSDELFARAEKLLGKAGILDLIAIHGHYATIGLVANVAQMTLATNSPRPFEVPAD